MMKTERIYAVEFMKYTNSSRDTVSNGKARDVSYIHTGKESFLVKESDLETYRNYGDGFRSIQFVGNMEF